MKQSEKSTKSRLNIMHAAMECFAKSGVDGVTLNSICDEYRISKGQFYHYFDSKADLYAECLKYCIDLFVRFMQEHVQTDGGFKKAISSYINARGEFWIDNPLYEKLILNAIVRETTDETIANIIKPLNEYNRKVFSEIISKNKLKPNISHDKAINYLEMAQEMYHTYLIKNAFTAENSNATQTFQQQVGELLEILLSGIFLSDD